MTWLEHGTTVAALCIETLNIRDVEIEPDTRPESKVLERQPAQDPAILSYNKTPTHQVAARPAISKDPQAKGKPANQAYDKAVQAWHDPSQLKVSPALNKKTGIPSDVSVATAIKRTTPPSAKPAAPIETKPSENVTPTATLTEPFSQLALQDATNGRNRERDSAMTTRATRRGRNRKFTRSKEDETQLPQKEPPKNIRSRKQPDGWGQPPFLQETPIPKKPHPLDGPIHRAEQRLAQGRKGRRQHHLEEQNGWATEDATDIQDMPEFDFQGNLSKFDKRGVFEQLRQDDTTADEARLVSFNRLSARPGTNGGRNLHYTENVLDSPKPNGRPGWNESESENSEIDRFSSGRASSRRNLSRASMRNPPSRKNSAKIPQDQTSSSGFQNRYSSQEHPHSGPRTKNKITAVSRDMRPDSPRISGPSFQVAASGITCPCITPLQMLELEQLATSELGLSDDMMAENAASCIAREACDTASNGRIIILAGNTKTGARAIAAGRQLRNHGVRVVVFVLGGEDQGSLLEIVKRQLAIYRNSGGQLVSVEKLGAMVRAGPDANLVVDALLGMHLSVDDFGAGDQATYLEVAEMVNRHVERVLAVDVPSGLDAGSGTPFISFHCRLPHRFHRTTRSIHTNTTTRRLSHLTHLPQPHHPCPHLLNPHHCPRRP